MVSGNLSETSEARQLAASAQRQKAQALRDATGRHLEAGPNRQFVG